MMAKMKSQTSIQIIDGEERVRKMLRSMRSFLNEAPGNYVTLALIGAQRSEQQLQRVSKLVSPFRWLDRSLVKAAQPGQVRFRLRLWEAGGRSAGGVVFTVEYTGVPEPHPPKADTEDLEVLRELRQEVQAASAERDQLRADLAGQREEFQVLLKRLRALEGGYREMEQAFIELCGSISG